MKTRTRLPILAAAALLAAGCICPPPDPAQARDITAKLDRIAALPASNGAFALASPFSDHMVLQRDCPIPVWGTGTPGAQVAVSLVSGSGGSEEAVADALATVSGNGRWIAFLPPQPAGGPFSLRAQCAAVDGGAAPSGDALAVGDVLVGDVWLCGGQSNMEMNFHWGVKDGEKELADADLPQVRLLNVPNVTDIAPRDSFDATWAACTPETARGFSACGFFFGRKLHRELGVPVGLVEADWSGTIAETWLSLEGAAAIPGLERAVENRRRDIAGWMDGGPEKFKVLHEAWEKEVDPVGEAAASPDYAEGEGWADAPMPFSFEQAVAGDYDGVVWLRAAFEAAPEQAAVTPGRISTVTPYSSASSRTGEAMP